MYIKKAITTVLALVASFICALGHGEACWDGEADTIIPANYPYSTFNGKELGDVIIVYKDGLTLYGNGGRDKICVRAKNVKVYGGEGADLIKLDLYDDNAPAAYFVGGSDRDVLYGSTGADYLEGGSGDDDLLGFSGNDTLIGGSGNDYILGHAGADYADAGSGNDIVRLVEAVSGGSGDDTIECTGTCWAPVVLRGDAGDDEIDIVGDLSKEDMQQGLKIILGGEGNDVITIWEDNAKVAAGAGNDFVFIYGAKSSNQKITSEVDGNTGTDTCNYDGKLFGPKGNVDCENQYWF